MPFGSFNLPPIGAGAAFSAAGLDALLTLARLSGSDGDLCEDTDTGAILTYKSAGSGVLIPSRFATITGDLVSNASGDAYITLADANVAAFTARGFTQSTTGTGTVTKSAGQPLELKTVATSDVATFAFGNTSDVGEWDPVSSDEFLLIMKVEVENGGGQDIWYVNGDKWFRLDPAFGFVAGDWQYHNAGSVRGTTSLTTGTTATWIACYYAKTTTSLITLDMQNGLELAIAEYSGFATNSGQFVMTSLTNYGSPTQDSTLKVYEYFLFEVSS